MKERKLKMRKISTYLLAGLMTCMLAGCANETAPTENPSTADHAVSYTHLEDISDLQVIADQLIFGAEYDFFEREDRCV